MHAFWIVLLSIVGAIELFGLGLVIHDMVYYGWEERKTGNKSEENLSADTKAEKE